MGDFRASHYSDARLTLATNQGDPQRFATVLPQLAPGWYLPHPSTGFWRCSAKYRWGPHRATKALAIANASLRFSEMTTIEPIFQEEMKAYDALKPELLKLCERKYAVFKGNEYLGAFDTAQAAYSAGLEKWGNTKFMVKQVLREDPVEHIPALYLGFSNACP